MFLCKTCKNTYKILLIMKKGYKQVNKKISIKGCRDSNEEIYHWSTCT